MSVGDGLIALAAAFAICISALGVALGQGKVASKTIESMARQPEMQGKLRTTMILAMGLMEALAIYGLLIAFIILGKIG